MWRALTPQRVVLLAGLLAGTFNVFLRPPFEGYDEEQHFLRAYQISEGALTGERTEDLAGGYLPDSLEGVAATTLVPRAVYERTLSAPLRRGDRVFRDFRNTVLYAPVPYVPHALAIAVTRSWIRSPATLLRIGRLAGLAGGFLLVWLAVRVTPIGKWLFVLLALTPMAMHQAYMLTADTVTNASVLLLLAIFLRLAFDPGTRLQGRFVAALIGSGILVTLSKQAYLPLLSLYFLAPVARAGSRRRYVAVFVTLAGMCLLALVAWTLITQDLYLPQRQAQAADPQAQLAFVLTHPARYAGTVAGSLAGNWERYLVSSLGYAGRLPLLALSLCHVAVFALVILVDKPRENVPGLRSKLLLLAAAAATVTSVATMNYLGWNPVGSDTIRFMQGRYFIPVFPLVLLLFANRRFGDWIPDRHFTIGMTCVAIACALTTIPVWHIG